MTTPTIFTSKINKFLFSIGLMLSLSFSSFACDGMSVNVISQVDLGNGTYETTLQYCESVSNGAGASVYGILLDVNGANVIGTTTPSFTSNSTGVVINYNAIDGNTVQWGEWDNNPSVSIFLNNGNATQCFTIVIQTDAVVTSVSVGGSSADSDLGAGFVSWNGRWTCRINQNVPPPPCTPVPPTFDPFPTVCQNSPFVLPTTSTNGQTGTWAPVVNTATVGTVNYTFTPSGGGCIGSAVLPLTVASSITPTFNPVPVACIGSSIAPLPTTSLNGVTGTWSPAIDNTTTTTYTFTPTPGGCAVPVDLTITVSSPITPTFNSISAICQNAVAPPLPTTSTNSITGTWSPATINTSSGGTQTYTFTPNPGQCANPTTMDITINNVVTPTFDPIAAVCPNAVVVLPTTSTNGQTGTWAPAVNTSTPGTINYTFTPTSVACPVTAVLPITVNSSATPTFNPIADVCVGTVAPVLPTTSTNGITGTWSGAVSTATAGTFNFTFTPTPPTCNNTAQISVTIDPIPVVDAGNYTSVCRDAAAIPLAGSPAGGTFSGTGVTGNSFSPAQGTQTITYTYTDGNGCTNTDNQLITIFNLPTVNGGNDITICEGQSVTLSGSGAFAYDWSNGVFNGQTFTPGVGSVTYTVTGADANGCIDTDNVTVTVVDMPTAEVIPDVTSGLPVLTVNFLNNSSVTTTYNWNYGNGIIGTSTNLNSTTSSYESPGTYTVVLTATNGTCTDYDTVQIIVLEFPEPIIDVPNVFSPNNDAANDFFFLDTEHTSNIQYIIVNRWGNLIFEADGVNPLWDGTSKGTPVEEGVYFYKYEVTGINGQLYTGHGNVTLIRD